MKVARPAADDGEAPTVEEAYAALAEARVSYGVLEQRVESALEYPEVSIVVAEGTPACDGEPGQVDYAPTRSRHGA